MTTGWSRRPNNAKDADLVPVVLGKSLGRHQEPLFSSRLPPPWGSHMIVRSMDAQTMRRWKNGATFVAFHTHTTESFLCSRSRRLRLVICHVHRHNAAALPPRCLRNLLFLGTANLLGMRRAHGRRCIPSTVASLATVSHDYKTVQEESYGSLACRRGRREPVGYELSRRHQCRSPSTRLLCRKCGELWTARDHART